MTAVRPLSGHGRAYIPPTPIPQPYWIYVSVMCAECVLDVCYGCVGVWAASGVGG